MAVPSSPAIEATSCPTPEIAASQIATLEATVGMTVSELSNYQHDRLQVFHPEHRFASQDREPRTPPAATLLPPGPLASRSLPQTAAQSAVPFAAEAHEVETASRSSGAHQSDPTNHSTPATSISSVLASALFDPGSRAFGSEQHLAPKPIAPYQYIASVTSPSPQPPLDKGGCWPANDLQQAEGKCCAAAADVSIRGYGKQGMKPNHEKLACGLLSTRLPTYLPTYLPAGRPAGLRNCISLCWLVCSRPHERYR